MKEALLSTALHLVELVVVLGGVYLVLTYFGVDGETAKVLIALAVAALVKFGRAHERSPLPDYVNG